MTYNKPKKTIEVIGRHGIDVTLADGDSSSSASYAFAEFMRDDAMHIKVADITEGGSAFSGADSVIVPYHEVGAVVVDMSASSVTRPDPYGCEEDSNADCEHTDLGTLYYCGGLQSGTIANDDDGTTDAGAIVTNAETWARAIYARNENKKMYLVSNGNILASTGGTDTNAEFGDTSIFVTVDAETGYYSAFVYNAPSHYAIYSEYTPEEYAPEP